MAFSNNQGAAGVRISLIDASTQDVIGNNNTVVGVVGPASRGAFNKILTLTSPANMDVKLGSGFNSPYLNQSLYAARAALNNGANVEFVRPYGELVVSNDDFAKDLKADTFTVTYVYSTDENPELSKIPKNSFVINHFASTRYVEDGYESFGTRKILTISEALDENTNVDFSLNQASADNELTDSENNIKAIALFSIINEDPTAAFRADDGEDFSGDSLEITTASYKTAHLVTDIITYNEDEISDEDTFYAINNAREVVTFEFTTESVDSGDLINTSHYAIVIGDTTLDTVNNIVTAIKIAMPYTTVTKDGFSVTVKQYFGIKDSYDIPTQTKIFTNSNNISYLNIVSSIVDSYIIDNSEFGRTFLNLGLANESYVKDKYTNTSFSRHYLLTAQGRTVANIYIAVSYNFAGKNYTFAGTVVPFVYQDTNLYIGNAADSIAQGFTFIVNENEDLISSVEDTTFNLGQSRYGIEVDVATTDNIILANTQTIDGVSITDGMKVLVKDQDDPTENGVYDAFTSSTWTRSKDANNYPVVNEFVSGTYIYVKDGSTYENQIFTVATSNPIILGTTPLSFDISSAPFTVDVATTADVTLSGEQTIDGIGTSSSRVLVKDQDDASLNGIYVTSGGAWSRATDADSAEELFYKCKVRVTSGTANPGKLFQLTTAGDYIVGESELTFVDITDSTDSSEYPPITSTFSKVAYDSTDPAIVNSAIWSYDPKNNRSTLTISNAWKLFSDKDHSGVDMLVSAGTTISNLGIKNTEELNFEVINTMLNICDTRKDCFSIFDGVDERNIDTTLRKLSGISGEGDLGKWGAIFDGRSVGFDSVYTKLNVDFVKSIEMAAIICANRKGGLFWLPPAGKDYGTIPGFILKQKYIRKYNFAEDPNSEIARLYDANINPTRVISGSMVIYGQKTMLRRASALNRLNVIMLVAGVHKKFANFLETKVFQLNTAAFRNNISTILNTELLKIKNANPAGLFDGKAICDDTNNPPTVIDSNETFVDLLLQPIKSSEFITLRTTVQRTGDSLTISNVQLIG